MKKAKEEKTARSCDSCGKKVYDGKHREVALERKRLILCGECGRIEFDSGSGRISGLLQALTMPLRQGRKGRNLTFHTENQLRAGDSLKSGKTTAMPAKSGRIPQEFVVNKVRPLYVTEIVQPAETQEGKKKRPRRKRRLTGFAVRAYSV